MLIDLYICKKEIMTTFTFRTDYKETKRLFAILQAYGVEDLQISHSDEELEISKEEIQEIKLGLAEVEQDLLISDEVVQGKADRVCMK